MTEMTTHSPADLAATVQDALDLLAGYAARDESDFAVMEDGGAALDALVARCEQLEREVASANFDGHWERAERAERERDEAREWGHRQADLLTECATACEAAEARVAELEAALRGYMATHDVIARGSRGAIARCECGQCRGTRAALAGEGEA